MADELLENKYSNNKNFNTTNSLNTAKYYYKQIKGEISKGTTEEEKKERFESKIYFKENTVNTRIEANWFYETFKNYQQFLDSEKTFYKTYSDHIRIMTTWAGSIEYGLMEQYLREIPCILRKLDTEDSKEKEKLGTLILPETDNDSIPIIYVTNHKEHYEHISFENKELVK